MQKFYIPKLYLAGYIRDFDRTASQYGLSSRTLSKGGTLTAPGVINNTAHYIRSGIVHLSLAHSSGNLKSLTFFGPGTIFPLGVVPHENLIDYEMVLRATTDIEVYSFSYPQLRELCVHDGELAAQILEQNCDFIGYLFYQDMNHAYAPTRIRVCDILYLFMRSIRAENRDIPLNQYELANLAGISRAQLERVIRELKEEKVIKTQRGNIHVESVERLLESCSSDIQSIDVYVGA